MRKSTVLIVEDQGINRRILRKILGGEYHILEAVNGAEALEMLLRGIKVDAVITDIVMPVMDGFELLKQLEEGEFQDLPVIVITGSSDQKTEQKALDGGAWDYVTKPVQPRILLSRLRNAIARSQINFMEKLKYLYEYDQLTGLYNRTRLFREVERLQAENPNLTFVFCRFDIDRFHLYNAAMGEEEGDKLLCHLADLGRKVTENVALCAFGRLEADVFCVFTPYRPEILKQKMDYVIEELSHYREDYMIEPSFGVYLVPNVGIPVEVMLSRAALAAQSCKDQYMSYVGFYDHGMDIKKTNEQSIVNDMKKALDEKQFLIYLQPKYNLKDEHPCGAEALARWMHPKKGMIMPGVFIPVFENNGFIAKLDYYMWEGVCRLLKRWKQEKRPLYPISVNMSRISLYNPQVVALLQNLVQQYGVEPGFLYLEVTESAYMSNPDLMQKTLRDLQASGFTILMDDFGSGYSSLNTLKEIDVDMLKVDMKFLPIGTGNVKSKKILASVLRMANWLNIPVIVEGVETEEQINFLKSIGYYYVQGYYYAKPMPVEEYEKLMEKEGEEEGLPEMTDGEANELDGLWAPASDHNLFKQGISIPLSVFEISDNYWHILWKNEAFTKNFDRGETEEASAHFFENRKLREICEEAVRLQGVSEGECFFLFERGEARWYHVRMQYIRTLQPVNILCGMFMEITEQAVNEREVSRIHNALQQPRQERTRMLVVDDAEATRKIISLYFGDCFDILEAENGREALELLQQNETSIEVILLDLIMPEMSGEEFLEYKNRMEAASDIPVIVISSEGDPQTQINMLRLGVNDYIVKPFVPELLQKRVGNVLEYNSRFQQLVQEYQKLEQTEELQGEAESQNEVNVFTAKEIQKYMSFMAITFDVVRLVDPKNTAVLSFNEEGSLTAEKYSCFKVWNKSIRCANCTSVCAEFEGCQKTKYEFIENNIFYVISRPIHIIQKDSQIVQCVLEIVSRVSDHLLMEKVGRKSMRQLLEETQNKIYMDELTQVFNRRFFDEMLFVHRGQDGLAEKVAFIMMDINHFKKINDQYGHAMGDQVLKAVAQVLKNAVRSNDSIIRYGGDEFLIVLTNCEESYVPKKMEFLRKAVGINKIAEAPSLKVSVACGFFYTDEFIPEDAFLQEMLDKADERMYLDKNRD
ncbi:MAG: EAL domain-containing protein [Lachnospiraceae bacterium]|nr:EAL domain-containing protein [Lachnospiraceae bacterium]